MMAATEALYNKVLGCILGAAAGDALGAPTEGKSTRQIITCFGKKITDFQTPLDDCLARQRNRGQVTDAFSIPYILSRHLLASGGHVSRRLAEDALLEWGASEWFLPFAGMTTRKAVNRLNQDNSQELWSYSGHLGNRLFKGHYYALSSNGAAVKAYPAGLLHPGNPEAAVRDVVELTMASHDDPLSISGAGAIAASIAAAFCEDATLFSITQASLQGAILGEELARKREDIWVYPGPSVRERMEMAIETALCHSGEGAVEAIRTLIGSGPAIAETVPAAFGLLIAGEGNVLTSLYDAVNIGDETSAIASLVGSLGGALRGAGVFPHNYLPVINQANGFDLEEQSRAFVQLVAPD